MFTCERCLFLTDKISNYERHLNSKKHLDLFGPGGPDKELEEQHQAIENNNTDNNPEEYACKKCAKLYKGKTFLIEHEKTCIGIDSLTCPRCMKTFSHKANKAKHIKINNCKPRSIFKYLEEKQKRLEESKKANPQTKDNNTVNSASTTTVHHTDSTETVSPNQINTNNFLQQPGQINQTNFFQPTQQPVQIQQPIQIQQPNLLLNNQFKYNIGIKSFRIFYKKIYFII